MALKLVSQARSGPFLLGLGLRALLVLLAQPTIRALWFLPFLDTAMSHPLDPWTAHLASGGSSWAFPYGPVMVAVLAPLGWLGLAVDQATGMTWAAPVGFGLTILLCDLLLLECLLRLFPDRAKPLMWLAWLSPIALYVSYWHGQVDVVPLLLLFWSLERLKALRVVPAGLLLGAAVATKLTILLALPFVLIYLFGNLRLRRFLAPFSAALAAAALGLQLPYLFSPGVQAIVLGSPEIQKVYALRIALGENLRIYLLPLLYLLVVFGAWRVRRTAFELLLALLGIGFFLVVLLTPASPGWYLWVVPFLAVVPWDRRSTLVLIAAFGGLYLAHHLLNVPGSALPALGLEPTEALLSLGNALSPHVRSLLVTMLIATGLILMVSMAREGIARNVYYRLSRKPIVVAMAGDSSSGKDTLATALTQLFGARQVTRVSGDDYHHWDRHRPMWQVLTHLNPAANDLERWVQDVTALAEGKPVIAPRYDHATGRFASPRRIAPRPVLLVSGLHALHPPALRERSDVTIFLQMDEGLRHRLKKRRDTVERHYSPEELERTVVRRREDAARFIAPQASLADLIFSLQPARRDLSTVDPLPEHLPLRLQVTLRRGLPHDPIVRVLIGLCGLLVDVRQEEPAGGAVITIEGDVTAEDLTLAARRLVPSSEELLDPVPEWREGTQGLMQLFVLVHIIYTLRGHLA